MRRAALLSVALAICAVPASAGAATITPTSGFFADDFTDNANCSLREAIEVANDDVSGSPEDSCGVTGTLGDDVVALEAGGPYVLDIAGPGEDLNATGDLDITSGSGDLAIDGGGAATTTIDTDDMPAWSDRVLHHLGGPDPLTVSDLTLTGGGGAEIGAGLSSSGALAVDGVRVTGNTTLAPGGGIRVEGSSPSLSIVDSVISDNTSGGDGGGILTSAAILTVDSSVIRGNSSASTSGEGGGLVAIGTTTNITDTVIADNDVTDSGAGVATGGGLAVGTPGNTVTVRGTTISGNKVVGGSIRFGGGVRAGFGTTLTLINSTVSGNEALGASADGAGINVDGGTTNIVHTTLGPNPVGTGGESAIQRDGGTVNVRGSVIETSGAAPACGGGSITSLDDNVVTDTSCFAETGNDDTDADPMLGLLADNGGPDAGAPGLLEGVFTHLPAAASTVVDHVPSGDCLDVPMGALTIDQRGLLRPRDGNGNGIADCEAGSVELQPAVAPPPAGGGSTPTTTTPPTPAPVRKKKCKKKKKGAAAAKKCKKKK